ncbi:MAG TPA: hypothetical protein VHR15_20225 [Ktedonobacterales bacterium]|jgi:hypothetical protein|nr:hypothetical protein [Ktedonobacterales bacterium]
MSQRPDDFYTDLGRFGASDELRPVYERVDADARAWSATVGDETPLIAYARSLSRRSREETMRMQSQPNHPEWEMTQRLPYTNPDYQPQQRPSRLRTWVAVAAAALVVALLGGSFYLLQASRNNGTPATPTATTAQPTATPLPTATATLAAACPTISSPDKVSSYQFGDISLSIYMSGVAYPASMLPAGTPLAPFKLGPNTDAHRGLPSTPDVNPFLDSAIFVTACNASKTISHRIDGLTVRVASFVPFNGDLNSWQFCDEYYQNGQVAGGGCGGGLAYGEKLKAAFPANAGTGAVVAATLVDANTEGPLPLTRAPGQSIDMLVALTPPTALGTYRFSFSVRVDGANLPFALFTDDLLLGPARKWTGAACANPAMQSQIPVGSTDAYICPES